MMLISDKRIQSFILSSGIVCLKAYFNVYAMFNILPANFNVITFLDAYSLSFEGPINAILPFFFI